jgi:LPXTG-site transpeptidase (sortase) family protein
MSLEAEDHTESRRRRPWRLVVAAALVLVGATLILAGPRWAEVGEPPADSTRDVVQPAEAEVARRTVVEGDSGPAPHRAAGVPRRVVVPALGVGAPVVEIAVGSDGVLAPPDDPRTLGWWRAGAEPGAAYGSALVTGHTVSTGGGVFDDLERLEAGDAVRVRTAAGVIGYRVRSVRLYRKASLARHAERLFDQSALGRLVLVTCEDWDGRRYLSNVVVMADPRG